jgi:hypothetical protein
MAALDTSSEHFRAIARTIVPEASELSEDAWSELGQIIAQALATRPPSVARQLSAFLTLIDVAAITQYARPFRNLSSSQRYGVLHGLETSRLTVLRRGMWGLRTLVFMGFYARREADAAIGYRADRRGWGSVNAAGPAP